MEIVVMREDWIECQLGDLLSLKNGFAFKSTKYISDGTPVLRIGDINNWLVNSENAKCVEENSEYENYVVSKGDILIAMSGATTGKFGIYKSDKKAYQNQRVGNLIPHSDKYIVKNYLYLLLYSLKSQIEKDAYGGAQPNISAKKIESLSIKFAPLPEQRAIVAKIEQLFSELDNGIDNLKTAQEQLKVYRQAVLKKAFEKRRDWKQKEFGKIVINYDGKRKPLSKTVREKFKGKYPYYGACEIIDYVKDYLFDGEYLLIGEDGANLLSKSKPLSFIASEKFWVNNHAHVVQPTKEINIKFLSFQFNSKNISQWVSGSAQPKLNQRNLNKIPIIFGKIQEQHQIVQQIESRLSVCDKVEETITENLQKAEALRQSILKKAFAGELLTEAEIAACKKEKDWEPAAQLLKRIKNKP